MNRVAVDVFVSRPLSSFAPDLPVVQSRPISPQYHHFPSGLSACTNYQW